MRRKSFMATEEGVLPRKRVAINEEARMNWYPNHRVLPQVLFAVDISK